MGWHGIEGATFEETWREALRGLRPVVDSQNPPPQLSQRPIGPAEATDWRTEGWIVGKSGVDGENLLIVVFIKTLEEDEGLFHTYNAMDISMGPYVNAPPPQYLVDQVPVRDDAGETEWRRERNVYPTGYDPKG